MMMLERIRELAALAVQSDPGGPNYFIGLESCIEVAPKSYETLESALQLLDPDSWNAFKRKCLVYVSKRHQDRGWHQLFDILNEVSGFVFLRESGYEQVVFLPESNSFSPDLRATVSNNSAFAEVKTIGRSDESLRQQKVFGRDELTFQEIPKLYDAAGLSNKFKVQIDRAALQLRAADPNGQCRKIIYLLVDPDPPRLPERLDQIEGILRALRPNDVELIAEINGRKDRFYAAT